MFYGLWELFVVLSYRSAFNTNWERLQGSGAVSFVVCLLGIGVIYGYSGLLTLIIKTLCGDSNVQLDVSKYANVTPISISFLLIILLLVVSHFVMVWLIYRLIDKVWKRRFYKYIVYVAVLLVGEFVMRITKVELSFLVLGLGLFVMNDLGWYPKRLRLIDNYLLVWCVMAALFSGVTTYYFMKVMEQKNLLQYATQLALASDADKDLIFVVKRNKQFVQDPRLLQYFEKNKDNSQNPKTIIKKIDSTYFKQFANDYTINYYLYNAKENYTLIDSEQAMRYKEFDQARHSTLDSHIHTQYLDPEDRHIYLYDTIYKPGQQIAGYVLIDMQKKVFGRSSILSTLLLPNTTNNEDVLYPNAIYQDGKLIYSSKDYNFAVNLPSNHRKDKNSYSFEGGYYILSYNAENNKQILVVNKHNIFLEIISLFSYYVYILFFLLIGYLLFKLLFSLMRLRLIRRIEFGFKNSIQILMPVMLLVSFIISALLAVNFMMSDYEGSTAETQNQQLVSSSRLILSYLNSTNYKLNAMFNKVSERDSFFNYINKIAKNERHDINIYDVQGSLITSSQPEIYQKEIFSHKIDPDAYNALAYEGKTLQIQKEKIGSLSYLSGYMPLMGSEGVIIGYLNIPFYNAVDANNNKISTLIIALTNSYAFMFLITAFISVAFSRRFTKVYDLILHQFEKIKLEKNELLKWPHDDEIGRLVAEYNKMVQKVEDSAKELANSERDAAWREMARQVAHEIKNPLNPLKLNIQYLQYQAQNETSPFAQKVKLLTAPLLEQIDNLAYIATQFSSFAKLPESQPERIDIPLFMEENMQVYEQDNRARVTLLCHASPLYIICDKSQLIRLVNNIVENAMQAMPGTREGVIAIEIGIEDGKAKLTFADNGIGIPNDVKEKIFSPYFTTKSSGTGLGLAMTKKMIELWGGTITFSSIDGEGTVFTILLPIAE
ncbi:MAG: hypothetical protein EBX41_06410 [Chitinophagia bacterium]|nr:hypothetical protein [Chitinophagia bacterium]